MFYHLPSIEAMRTDAGKAILKECDMLAWITPGDPPLLVNNAQVVEAPSNRGEWLHCIHHARAVRRQCVTAEVPCIVIQDQEGPKTGAAEFLVQHLKATGKQG